MLLKLAGEGASMKLDDVAFPLLLRATPVAEHYPMLARECERSQDLKWTSRILESCKAATADSTPTALVDWLQLNIIESKERHPLLDEAAELFAFFLLYQLAPIEPSLEDRMLKSLEDCHFLSHDFWLGGFVAGLGNSDHWFTALGTKFAAQVCLHAIAVLHDDETPPTQRQWLAAFIKQELANAFPDIVSKDQVD